MDLPSWIYKIDRLVINNSVGDWCLLPYPGHKKGCPNYGKADRCPPQSPMVGDHFDLSKPLWFIHSEFDLSGHEERMKDKHPEWSKRQCRCVLYWQPKSRKQLKQRVKEAKPLLGFNEVATTPEAMGINVYATARLAGLTLERIRNLETCRHVALVGTKAKGQMSLF